MLIQVQINYHKEGVLTFEPRKVLSKLKENFPEMECDLQDQSRYWLKSFFKTVKEKNLNPPDFIIESKWRLFTQNAPTFLFTIPSKKGSIVEGEINRWLVNFEQKEKFELEKEEEIISFLQSLNYGEIYANTQTKYFCKPRKNYKDNWILNE